MEGELRVRLGIVRVLGVLSCMLAAGGILVSLIKPESAKDTWLILGPIIGSLVPGAVVGSLVNSSSAGRRPMDQKRAR
jgi:hypothetical protein